MVCNLRPIVGTRLIDWLGELSLLIGLATRGYELVLIYIPREGDLILLSDTWTGRAFYILYNILDRMSPPCTLPQVMNKPHMCSDVTPVFYLLSMCSILDMPNLHTTEVVLNNFMAYGTRRFNAAFTRALQ